jgi:hypothetical protein
VDPNNWERNWAGLGEALEGNELVKSDYEMKFRGFMLSHLSKPQENVAHSVTCVQELDEADAEIFEYAVENHYWYQMVIGSFAFGLLIQQTSCQFGVLDV